MEEYAPSLEEIVNELQHRHPDIFKAIYFEIRSLKLENLLNDTIGNFSMPNKEGESDEGSTE